MQPDVKSRPISRALKGRDTLLPPMYVLHPLSTASTFSYTKKPHIFMRGSKLYKSNSIYYSLVHTSILSPLNALCLSLVRYAYALGTERNPFEFPIQQTFVQVLNCVA